MRPIQFELTVLAKPYFRPEDLLLAVDERDRVMGFLHFANASSDDLTDESDSKYLISVLCVDPDAESDSEIANRLLTACESMLHQRQATAYSTRPMLPDCPFYLGLGFGDSCMGITTGEQREFHWLTQAGFQQERATSFWQIDLASFQAPVDRLQIQIRRSAHVDRILDEPVLPWRQASTLGHTELMAFQLTLRSERKVVEQLLTWCVGPELATTADAVVWLWPFQVGSRPQASDQLLFLIAESLRQLADDRVDQVRTVSDSSNTAVNHVLSRLGFQNSLNGFVLTKNL